MAQRRCLYIWDGYAVTLAARHLGHLWWHYVDLVERERDRAIVIVIYPSHHFITAMS
jgi:hypothetical protein